MTIATTYTHACPEECLSLGAVHVVHDDVDPDAGVYYHQPPRCAWTRVELALVTSEVIIRAEEVV